VAYFFIYYTLLKTSKVQHRKTSEADFTCVWAAFLDAVKCRRMHFLRETYSIFAGRSLVADVGETLSDSDKMMFPIGSHKRSRCAR